MILFDKEYTLIENERDAFNEEEVRNLCTDYFEGYDYIVGDIAYSKLRLKGFTKKGNKLNNKNNDFSKVKDYIKNNCAYGCRYFILERKSID